MCSYRHDSGTETVSTDEDFTFGGLGKFEYSQKGLPHGLLHQTELVMRGGHHLSACTSVVETAHKVFIKMASRFARVYSSRNRTEVGMLQWCQTQRLWIACIKLAAKSKQDGDASSENDDTATVFWLHHECPYALNWSKVRVWRNRLPVSTFTCSHM